MKLRAFRCDLCGRESMLIHEKFGEVHPFPYNDGWIYVYQMKLKFMKDKHIEMHDGHFCSPGCLGLYIFKQKNDGGD